MTATRITAANPQNAEPIRKSVTVPLSPAEAFDLFVTRMDTWWPLAEKSVSAGRDIRPSQTLRVEPGVGGRIVEEMADGTEALWGEILDWEPGARFRMTWVPGRAAEMPTEVDVTFTRVGPDCRVDLTHSGFEAHASGTEARAMYDGGWHLLIGTVYAKAAKLASHPMAIAE